MYTRRQFGELALGALPAMAFAAKIKSKVKGLSLGMQSYTFYSAYTPSTLPTDILDTMINSMVENGLGTVDIYNGMIEPKELVAAARGGMGRGRGAGGGTPQGGPPQVGSPQGAPPQGGGPRGGAGGRSSEAREALNKWRKEAPKSFFEDIRQKFTKAGIEVWATSGYSGQSEEELDRAFEMSQLMGAKMVVVMGGNAELLKTVAQKRDMLVGLSGPTRTPQGYVEALNASKNFRAALDIGDTTPSGFDSLSFVRENPEKIGLLYLKDKKKTGASVPWGDGDSRVAEILRLVRDKKYPIRCMVDNDYPTTTNRSDDVKRSIDWVKKTL
ncbi:MAG: hypothetical protein NTW28_21900 [Candidatus Solibacter sp.]|nr:hypothetical protein [Candidatus Solibacter sp.]